MWGGAQKGICKLNTWQVIAVVGMHAYDLILCDKSPRAPSIFHAIDCIQCNEGQTTTLLVLLTEFSF